MADEFVRELFEEALEVSGALEDFIEAMDEHREAFSVYDGFWNDAANLFSEWGVEDNMELLGALCSIPRNDVREGLKELADSYNIPAIVQGNEDLREELFLAIQQNIGNYHIDLGNATHPQKENMARIAKMLANAFDVLGYGICENGLLVVMRTFNHGAAEGVTTDWYTEDSEYDAEDFGYYDGIENEKITDAFFAQYPMSELLNK